MAKRYGREGGAADRAVELQDRETSNRMPIRRSGHLGLHRGAQILGANAYSLLAGADSGRRLLTGPMCQGADL